MTVRRASAAAAPGVRNVLLITGDQWRGDTLGVAGHCVQTPNLDRLAAEGAWFRRHHTVTSPCGPARASLHTGLYLHNHRSVVNGTPLDRRHTNMALEARRAGYAPTLFGYTDASADPDGLAPRDPRLFSYEGVLPGYDVGQLLLEDFKPWLAQLRRNGYGGLDTPRAAYAPADGRLGGPSRFEAAHSETQFIADAAIDFLSMHADRPWFAHVSFLRPHPPWTAPAEYRDRYDATSMPPARRAQTARDDASVHPLAAAIQANVHVSSFVPGFGGLMRDLDADAIGALRASYYALMTEVDHHLGRLLDWLREAGQLDDTLIVFTADHGEYLGDHHLFGKMGFQPEAFHVPLIVRDPRLQARRGIVVDAFTESVDVLPTVLDVLGIPCPPACDGASLTPFLRGEAPPKWRDAVHWELDFRTLLAHADGALGDDPDAAAFVALRDARSLYVHFASLAPLLFDLDDDPFCRRNLLGLPDGDARRARHLAELLSWRLRHEDRRLSTLRVGERGLVSWRD